MMAAVFFDWKAKSVTSDENASVLLPICESFEMSWAVSNFLQTPGASTERSAIW